MSLSAHRRPPAPPQPSTVIAEPATPETVTQDWASRRGPAGQVTATRHTWGKR